MKIDYNFKSQVLNDFSDVYKEYVKIRRSEYFYLKSQTLKGINLDVESGEVFQVDSEYFDKDLEHLELTPEIYYNFAKCKEIEDFYLNDKELKPIYEECERIFKANSKRRSRLKKRVSNIIEKDSLFLTLTFNNETLKKTSSESRRKYVRRFLKSFNVPYVANIDFGKKNGREHYHALLQKEIIDYHLWRYGAINGLKVRVNENTTPIKLASYIAKLTNHAIKETTKRCALIYSR